MNKQKIILTVLLLCTILTFSSCSTFNSVDATLTTTEGKTIVCNGYEYKKMFNKYDNDKDNPYYRATITVTDEIKKIEKLDTSNLYRIFLNSGWNFTVEDTKNLTVGTTITLEGYVVYQNFSNLSSTAIYVENYTIINN